MKATFKWITIVVILIFSVQYSIAQEKILTGVVSEAGIPLPGVSVIIKGTQIGTQTDLDGKYSLKVKQGDILTFSFIGQKDLTKTVGTAAVLDVVMTADDAMLDEVVVVAYGTASKESVTGAISMVRSEDIAKRPSTNVLGALEGSSAGVQVNNTSGQPGSEPEVRIRGFSSLRGNVNGVDANSPLYVVDGVPYGGNISDINPSDIESMSVLKDASSTTLYGNRASNGVILITTKKASKGQDGFFNVNIKQGLYNRGVNEYNRVGPDDFMNIMWTGYRNSLITDKVDLGQASQLANQTLISDVLQLNIYNLPADQLFENGRLRSDAKIMDGYAGDLDWYKPIERMGYFQDINASGRVSSDRGGAFFSAGILNNEGYFKNSDFKRLTGRVNADYQVNDWLKVGTNLAGSHQESLGVPGNRGDSNSFVNPFMYARRISPIYPVHLHDPKTGAFVLDEKGNKIYDNGETSRTQFAGRHVVWENDLNQIETIRNTLNGQVYADIKFLNDFTFTIRGDLSVQNSEERRYENAIIGDGSGTNGRARRATYRYKTYTGQQLLNWEKSFGDHHFQALLGHENFSTEYSYLYAMKADQNFAGMPELINFNDMTNLYDYTNIYRTEGYLSRLKYNYANRYFLEASFRRDGSSKFSADNRWGNFWSVGGSWMISRENFFKVPFIDDLKVRASYGEVGNDQGASWYAYQDLYAVAKNGGAAALYKSQNGNEHLKWETSSSFGGAIEARFFDRVNLTAEYFDKRSKNLLFNLSQPLSNGSTDLGSAGSVITSNVGSISNKGIELSIDVDVIRNENFRWNIGANATWLKNKIEKLPEQNRVNGIIDGIFKRDEGKSIYEYYLYQYVGVDQMNGQALYKVDDQRYNVAGSAPNKESVPEGNLVHINGENYTNYITYAKREHSGNPFSDVEGSFNTTLSYKRFTLSALFTYSLGGKVYDYSYSDLMSVTASPSALHKDILNSWSGAPQGMTIDSPNRIDPNGTPIANFATATYTNGATSDRWLKDASYLVIKNVSLSYDMPGDLMKKLGMTGMALNFGVENLATFTKRNGMNPQQTFDGRLLNAYVTPRTYTFGVNLTF
ncbi:SusC/RagA family TonB-linked outer membrane protein [Flavobacterium sp. JP2137]|uniref:SusC/RagA family TonB-linked outer membrane protein n=1 Tax=Flavobacterium sp. JP2137 TaxID=3414510 RepID=UPI003D2FCBF0